MARFWTLPADWEHFNLRCQLSKKVAFSRADLPVHTQLFGKTVVSADAEVSEKNFVDRRGIRL